MHAAASRLALFDLDHTLIPFDSGLAWTRFLIDRGVFPPAAEQTYLGYCRQYVAGTLDIFAMHRAGVAPLAAFDRDDIDEWVAEFALAMVDRIPADMRALVRRHQDDGEICAIVTATERLVAAPFAQLLGVEHLVSTEAAVAAAGENERGRFTGEIDGLPCFHEHKLTRVQGWLAQAFEPPRGLHDFAQSWFYSDSISDLPLLQAVTHPVAVRPDERLAAHAQRHGWPVIQSDCR